MNKKFFTILLSILILFNVFGMCASAEDVEIVEDEVLTKTVEPEPEASPADSAYAEFVSKVEAYASTGYEPRVMYTSDSVAAEGVYLEPYADTLKFEVGMLIKPNTASGIVVYDDPATPIIEGIRVNGAEITSYTVPFDLDNPQEYIVEVRLVYAEGLMGTIAKISNGDFDWQTIMEEPLLAMQIVYYAIAAISLIAGGLGVASSKKKKVKSAEDIAAIVDRRVKEGCEMFAIQYTELLNENLLPVFHTVADTNKAVVKAITVSTSKAKEAPVALLDLLKEVSDVDVENVIESAREDVLKHIADLDAKRENVRNTLHHIADGTYQEVQDVEQTSGLQRSEAESVEASSEEGEAKSIF